MINYFIRPGGAYIKIDTTTQVISIVINRATQKILSSISNNIEYYLSVIDASAGWQSIDQTTYEENKTIVLQTLNN